MSIKRQISSILLSVVLTCQVGLASVALAESTPTPTSVSTPASTPTPTATPSPAVSPAANAGEPPSPSASPSTPASTPKTDPPAAASPTPKHTPKPKKEAVTGPDGCGGVAPSWVFDTTIRKWVEADKASFSCDKASGYYLSPKYFYDKQSGWYKIIPAAPDAAPLSANLITAPNVVHTVLGDLSVGSKDYEAAKALGLLNPTDGILVGSTGPGSNNQARVSNDGQTWTDLTNLVNVINTLQSNAKSGDVLAGSNTQVGDVSSGTASVIANLINLLASAWSWANGDLNFFTQTLCNFNQTCKGDINLNPVQTATNGGGQVGGGTATVAGTGADSTNRAGVDNSSTLDVNAKNSGNIVNNVDLNAKSGNATVNKNTTVGNVASGNAVAQANIVNLINSFINSGSSFFGVLNIFGNLNGDILFPKGFLNGLIPSGAAPSGQSATGVNTTGPGSTNQANVTNNKQTTINNTASNGVNNNINTNATSGNATAGSNTVVGNVGSGSATTTQGLFNLSNSSIFGDNAVLVIVNVLGRWVGKIMTLPGSGDTQSALLTGNAQVGQAEVRNTGPDSNNQAGVHNNETAKINQSSVGTITNNVNVNAQSGDASANKNTRVGDVTTGDAKAASSVANIFNSVLNVKHWFGVLVINVFGDWLGDVNHDSEAGGAPAGGVRAEPAHGAAPAAVLPKPGIARLFGGASGSGSTNSGATTGATTQDPAQVQDANGKVLTAAAHQESATPKAVVAAKARDMSIVFGLSALGLLIAGVLGAIGRKLKDR